jgi:hypothetical protein
MKQYSIIIALSICSTLSAMEYTQDKIIRLPSSQKLRKAFWKQGYAAWVMNSQFPKTFGNKELSVRGLESYLRLSLHAHNNAYTEEQLTAMTHKYMDIIYTTSMTDRISKL